MSFIVPQHNRIDELLQFELLIVRLAIVSLLCSIWTAGSVSEGRIGFCLYPGTKV